MMDAQQLIDAIRAAVSSVETFMASEECGPDAYAVNVQIIGALSLLADKIESAVPSA